MEKFRLWEVVNQQKDETNNSLTKQGQIPLQGFNFFNRPPSKKMEYHQEIQSLNSPVDLFAKMQQSSSTNNFGFNFFSNMPTPPSPTSNSHLEDSEASTAFKYDKNKFGFDISSSINDKKFLRPVVEGEDDQQAQVPKNMIGSANSIEDQNRSYKSLIERYYNQSYFVRRMKNEPFVKQKYSGKLLIHTPIKFQHSHKFQKVETGPELFSGYLIKYSKQFHKIYITNELSHTQTYEILGDYAQSVVLNRYTGRYYMYDNDNHELVLRSVREQKQLCRTQTVVHRKQPIMYMLQNLQILILAGGYTCTNGVDIIGSDKIEIFEFEKWTISTCKIFKMQYGRIAPSLFELKTKQNKWIVILGGNRCGSRTNGTLQFNKYQTQNNSVNSKAAAIEIQNILENMELPESNFKINTYFNVKSDKQLDLCNCVILNSFEVSNNKPVLMLVLYKIIYSESAGVLFLNQTKQEISSIKGSSNLTGNLSTNKINESIVYLDSVGQRKQIQIKKVYASNRCIVM